MKGKQDGATVTLPFLSVSIDLKWLTLITMVFQNTLLVLLMRYSRLPQISDETQTRSLTYLTSTAVVMSELFKFFISVCGMFNELPGKLSFVEYASQEIFHIDTIKLMVPGLLYTIQNNLLFIALSNLEAAVYQVTYQLKILTTAMFSVFMLNKKITSIQTIALFVLFIGVSLVQIGQLPNDDSKKEEHSHEQNQFLGLVCVLLACCSSGFAGVYFEKILKKGRKVSLFVRNLQLSMFGVSLGIVMVLMKDGGAVMNDGFFQGYNRTTWSVIFVQAGSGFVIASVMKYADNILKGFATAISILLSAYLSTFLFGFVLSAYFLAGTFLVVVSVFLYGYKPQKSKSDRVINNLRKDRTLV